MSTSADDFGLVAIIAGVVLVFATGPYCLTYLLYRFMILCTARGSCKEKPAKLFTLSVLTGYVWLLFSPLIFLICILLSETSRRGSSWGELVMWLLVFSIPFGALGWIILAVFHFKRTQRYRVFIKDNPPPKLQIWLQDIIVGVFSLGLTMTMLVNGYHLIQNQTAVIALAIYELVTQFVMFFAILDVCRFSDALNVPRARAMYMFALMFVNAFFPVPVLTAMAWNVWRRAMFLAECPEPVHQKVILIAPPKPVELAPVVVEPSNETQL